MSYTPDHLLKLAAHLEGKAVAIETDVTVSDGDRKAKSARFYAGACRWAHDQLAEKKTPEDAQAQRIATLFNRRLTTAWSDTEIKVFKKLRKREVLTDEALTLLEAYYKKERAKGEMGHHRRDLSTFLNNFDGELDRASQGQQKLSEQPSPDGWETFTRTSPQYCEWVGEYQHAPAFMRSDFEKWKTKL